VAKAANMPVVEAKSEFVLQPNQVYVMPPNVQMKSTCNPSLRPKKLSRKNFSRRTKKFFLRTRSYKAPTRNWKLPKKSFSPPMKSSAP
jgi:hypothetical protein